MVDFANNLSARGGVSDINYSLKTVIVDEYTLCVPSEGIDDGWLYRTVKRIADIVIAIIAIVVLLPLMIVTMILIWLDDLGPMIYRQTRIGKCGQPFRFYKFRSMRMHAEKELIWLHAKNEAEGAHFKIKEDPRITKVGRVIRKLSIDEIPQLFSVLTGTMSIVGPRPHLPREVSHYAQSQEARLLVKPGLLCMREITGRSELNFDDWVASDIEYVRNRTLWLDLKIFVMAFPAVLSRRGAH